MTWDVERLKLASWRDKFYDTDKITGTMQRFKVTFLQEALGHQMTKFHRNLERMQKQFAEVSIQLQDVNRRLRARRRELMPLQRGIYARTLEVRRERFQFNKQRANLAAAKIQGLIRGRQTRRKIRLGLLPAADVAQVTSDLDAWAHWQHTDASGAATGQTQQQYYDAYNQTYTTAPATTAAGTTALSDGYTYDGTGYSAYGQYGYAAVPSNDQYLASQNWQSDHSGWFYGGWNGTEWQGYYPTADAAQSADATAAYATTAHGYSSPAHDAGYASPAHAYTSPAHAYASPAHAYASPAHGADPAAWQSPHAAWHSPEATAISGYDAAAYGGAGGSSATDTHMDGAEEELYPVRGSPKRVKPRKRVVDDDDDDAVASVKGPLLDLSPRFPLKPKLHAAAGPRPQDSCVPRDPYSGMPTMHIPRMLRHKLALVDREVGTK